MTGGRPTNLATRLICPLTCSTAGAMRADMERAARLGADTVECRLDFLKDPPAEDQLRLILADPPVDLIVTNRAKSDGGHFDGSESQRLAILRAAAEFRPAYIDVEMSVPPSEAPEASLIVSYHDFSHCPADVDVIAAALSQIPADVMKLAFTAEAPQDALRALDLLRRAKKPTIALAMSEAGVISRILAKKFGAFGTFASLAAGSESAPGQLTIGQMKNVYRWDAIRPETAVYGVIGCPVAHSMSPAVHNAAFAAAGIDAVYVPLMVQQGADTFNRFMDELLGRPWLDWRGLSVTLPHKENALAYVGAEKCDELARKIGAINTISIAADGTLRGDNADYAAAIDALCSGMNIARDDLANRTVTVLGAGGVARAIVAALVCRKADVTICNRTLSRAQKLAEEFSCVARGLEDAPTAEAEILINCTSIGMHRQADVSPLEELPASTKVVFDTVYNPIKTRLLEQAEQAGCICISGLDMFVNQAVAQFETWTGKKAPRDVMQEVVIDHLSGSGR